MIEIKVPFHQQLNEDHRHQLDRYNDEEELVERRYKRHDMAKRKQIYD
jgi:hypothetical protein